MKTGRHSEFVTQFEFRLMKFCLLFFCLFQLNTLFAQADSGKITLAGGYGLGSLFYTPNLNIHQQLDTTPGSQSSRTDFLTTQTKIRPIMFKVDYSINNRSSFGLLFMYNGYVATGLRLDSNYVAASNSFETELKQTRLTMNRFRFELTYTLLFKQKREWIRSYFYTGVGWNKKFVSYYEGEVRKNVSESINDFENIYFPVAMRFAYGFRIRITNQLSIHNEFGLGGPLYSLGLTYKPY